MIFGLVELARDETLTEHRRRNHLVNCEPSVSIPWLGERLDVLALGLLSLVMGIASWSRTTFPPAGITLDHDAALCVGSQSASPSSLVLNVDVLPWVIGELHCGELDEQFLSLRVKSSWVTWVCTLEVGSRVRMLQGADDEIVFWRKLPTHAYELFSRSERFLNFSRSPVSPC